MQLKEWLLAERSRQTRLATHLNIKPPVVAAWISGKKPVPVRRAPAIEQFTGGEVTRRDLFPEDWQSIWPEMAKGDVVKRAA